MLKMAVGGGRGVGQYEDAILDFIHPLSDNAKKENGIEVQHPGDPCHRRVSLEL